MMIDNVLSRLLGFLLVFLVLVFVVRVASFFTSRSWPEFPEECPSGSLNCVHVTIQNSYGSQDLFPLVVFSSMDQVKGAVKQWIFEENEFVTLQHEEEGYIHVTMLSTYFGFPDDVAVRWRCNVEGEKGVVIEVHSQSQMGYGDMGVNHNRVHDFFLFLKAIHWDDSPCTI